MAVLGPRLGIRGLTRGMWGGNGDVKINVGKQGCVPRCRVARKFMSSYAAGVQPIQSMDAMLVGRGRSVGVVAPWAWSRPIAPLHGYSAPVRCCG